MNQDGWLIFLRLILMISILLLLDCLHVWNTNDQLRVVHDWSVEAIIIHSTWGMAGLLLSWIDYCHKLRDLSSIFLCFDFARGWIDGWHGTKRHLHFYDAMQPDHKSAPAAAGSHRSPLSSNPFIFRNCAKSRSFLQLDFNFKEETSISCLRWLVFTAEIIVISSSVLVVL